MSTPGPPPGLSPDLGLLRLHLQGSALTRTVTPSVTINQQPVPVQFGLNQLPVHPGAIDLHAQTRWLRTFGQADLSFRVDAGQVVEVWYVPPMHQFTTGSIGFEKQHSKGRAVYVGLLAAIAVVVVLVVLVAALG